MSQNIKELVLNTKTPIILRHFGHKWECFNYSIEEWCSRYDEGHSDSMKFEEITKFNGLTPQWERKLRSVQMTAGEFLQKHSDEQDCWTSLSYKRVYEMPLSCINGINFKNFGFPNGSDDFTCWLSSKGANTSCHYDTYGCNIVVQVYGSKSWLLFPPETPLTKTRIPYEESSVYTTENFYSPSPGQLNELKKFKKSAYYCVLKPKDVLIVPRHWWHFVETLENALSINYWVPLKIDVEAQLDECIVKFIIENFLHNVDAQSKYILNPNQADLVVEDSEMFAIINHLATKYSDQSFSCEAVNALGPAHRYHYFSDSQLADLMNEIPFATQVPQMSEHDYMNLLELNSNRFDVTLVEQEKSPLPKVKEVLLNSICSESVITAIRNEFLKRYNVTE